VGSPQVWRTKIGWCFLRTDPVAANEEQQQGDHGAHCAAKRQARANAMDAPGTSRLTASRDEPGSGGVSRASELVRHGRGV